MSESGSTAVDPVTAPEPQPPDTTDTGDLRFAALLVVVLAVLGAVFGLVWAAWSPAGPRAYVLAPGVFLPDETEAFVAGDGRFLVLGALVGALAGLLSWRAVTRRGPLIAAALGAGGLAGAALMEAVGHLTGGGTFTGTHRLIGGVRVAVIDQLPLSLHAQGLLLVEPALALLVYGVLVAFTAHDDLGHPDPVRAALVERSAQPGDHPQDGGRDGDTAGSSQQRDLPLQ